VTRLRSTWKKVVAGVYRFEDTCNVYLIKKGHEAIVFDFGSGAWRSSLGDIGVKTIRHVFLTHAHRDQVAGLAARSTWPFEVHASDKDLPFYQPEPLARFWKSLRAGGCPSNYLAPREPLPFVQPDVRYAVEIPWANTRVCPFPTPGHTQGALTYLVAWNGKALAFSGDAVHAGGTIYQPYHLEWDHWTAEGSLAAWYGLERLRYCQIDFLLPSHGPLVKTNARKCIQQAQDRLMAFIRAKGSVCENELDRWLPLEPLDFGAKRVLPDLYYFGANSYLLVGENGEGFIVDPTRPDIDRLLPLMKETGVRTITAATASHFHRDHSDGLNWLRDRFGTPAWLHPWVAEPIRDQNRYDLPWLPVESVQADRVLPEAGTFRWNKYRFQIRPFPGQTWWHCAFDTTINDRHVLFSGDNFQPPSRWNGTGGFCAYNGCQFTEGFTRSAETALEIAPDLIANGHGCIYHFHAPHYRKLITWSTRAEKAVKDLCPTSHWRHDYDCRQMTWDPYRTETRPGESFTSSFTFCNQTRSEIAVIVEAVAPGGWRSPGKQRRFTVPPGKTRRAAFTFRVPRKAAPGQYLIAADVTINGRPVGEAAVSIVEVST